MVLPTMACRPEGSRTETQFLLLSSIPRTPIWQDIEVCVLLSLIYVIGLTTAEALAHTLLRHSTTKIKTADTSQVTLPMCLRDKSK